MENIQMACRLCLKNDGNLIDLLDDVDDSKKLTVERIRTLYKIKVCNLNVYSELLTSINKLTSSFWN